MSFVSLNPEKIWHENLICLSTSPVRCSYFTLGYPKKSFSTVLFIHTSDYLCYLRRKKTVIDLPTSPKNVTTLACELQNFFIWLKVCCILSNVGSSEKSQLWVVISGSEKNRLWCVATAMSQQVFRVTTFCINTCLVFFDILTLISCVVHHAVLKFSPCRNKPLLQALTHPYQYKHSSCSVPRCSTRAMQIGSIKQQ